jgi:hypothetical protein
MKEKKISGAAFVRSGLAEQLICTGTLKLFMKIRKNIPAAFARISFPQKVI